MDNLLGAAAAARESDPDPSCPLWRRSPSTRYLDGHGHTFGLVRLLELAVEQVRDEPGRCHTLLTKLGNARYNEGELAAARPATRRRRRRRPRCARSSPDRRRARRRGRRPVRPRRSHPRTRSTDRSPAAGRRRPSRRSPVRPGPAIQARDCQSAGIRSSGRVPARTSSPCFANSRGLPVPPVGAASSVRPEGSATLSRTTSQSAGGVAEPPIALSHGTVPSDRPSPSRSASGRRDAPAYRRRRRRRPAPRDPPDRSHAVHRAIVRSVQGVHKGRPGCAQLWREYPVRAGGDWRPDP